MLFFTQVFIEQNFNPQSFSQSKVAYSCKLNIFSIKVNHVIPKWNIITESLRRGCFVEVDVSLNRWQRNHWTHSFIHDFSWPGDKPCHAGVTLWSPQFAMNDNCFLRISMNGILVVLMIDQPQATMWSKEMLLHESD